MRQHFHRCGNLRVVYVEASEISGKRGQGGVILDELCEAKGLARCVGLAECDVLSYAQKRELLAARVTRMREETGMSTALGDLGGERGREIEGLAMDLLDERSEILAENQRLLAEATAASDARGEEQPLGTAEDLLVPELTLRIDEGMPTLRSGRLDAIDRALEAMAEGRYGVCARCSNLIDIARLRTAPDTHVCDECATAARRGD